MRRPPPSRDLGLLSWALGVLVKSFDLVDSPTPLGVSAPDAADQSDSALQRRLDP